LRFAIGIRQDDGPARLQITLDSIARYSGEIVATVPVPVTGGAASLNWLMGHTDAPAVVLLESGCIVGPRWLEHLSRALESSPRAGLAGPSTNRAWNSQRAFPDGRPALHQVQQKAAIAERRFGDTLRAPEPLHSLSDFCYAVRRDVFDAIGPADEAYGNGPVWEMAFNLAAARAGFESLWVCAAYVWRPALGPQRARDQAALFAANRARYHQKLGAMPASRPPVRQRPAAEVLPPPRSVAEVLPPPCPATEVSPPPRPVSASGAPLVSCIMPTYDRRQFIAGALGCFSAQDYPALELIVVDDGSDPIRDLLPADPNIRYIRLEQRMTVGAKRNLACREARGGVIAHWDDDDWYPPTRVTRQVSALDERGADVCGSSAIYFLDRVGGEAYLYDFRERPWVAGTTLAYRREFWERHPFRDVQVAEDTSFIWRNGAIELVDLRDPSLCVASIHPRNVSPKRTQGRYWSPVPAARIAALMGTAPEPSQPLVSCLLLTRDRRPFIPLALSAYASQRYRNRELLVFDDGDDPIEDLVREVAGVRYQRVPRMSLGAKRNAACEAAGGELIAYFDDDDWYGPHRLERQLQPLLRGRADFTGLRMRAVLQLPQRKFWTASDALHRKMFACDVAGGTAAFARSTWRQGRRRYHDSSVGEDGEYLREAARRGKRILRVDGEDLFVYVRHGANTWQFETGAHGRAADWRRLEPPAAFSAELVDAYAAAAAAQARRTTA
jgi:glycosyltransferase involved in cell wall biosynthesis